MMLTKIWIIGCISEILWSIEMKFGTHCQQGSYQIWEEHVLQVIRSEKWLFLLVSFEQFCQKIMISRCLWIPCFMLNLWMLIFKKLLNHIYHSCTLCFSSLSSSGSALRLLYLWCLQLYYITCIWWAGWCVGPAALLFVLLFLVYVTWVWYVTWVIPFGFILLFSCFKDPLKDFLFWSPI